MDATITCDYNTFVAMRKRVAKTQRANRKLRETVEEQKILIGSSGGGDGSLERSLIAAVRAALPIVQFAQGNLDPETIRGWPNQALIDLANAVLAMPTATDHEKEWAHDALAYAKSSQALDMLRATGQHTKVGKTVPRSASADEFVEVARKLQESATSADSPE